MVGVRMRHRRRYGASTLFSSGSLAFRFRAPARNSAATTALRYRPGGVDEAIGVEHELADRHPSVDPAQRETRQRRRPCRELAPERNQVESHLGGLPLGGGAESPCASLSSLGFNQNSLRSFPLRGSPQGWNGAGYPPCILNVTDNNTDSALQ